MDYRLKRFEYLERRPAPAAILLPDQAIESASIVAAAAGAGAAATAAIPKCLTGPITKYLTEIKELGRGGFGRVFSAAPTDEGYELADLPEIVTVKEIEMIGSGSRSIATEIHFLSRHKFDHSLKYFGCVEYPGEKVYIVMEYFESVDLATLLALRALTLPKKILIIRSICKALLELHSHGLYHRDLKPENILIGSDGVTVKLIDYGLSCDTRARVGFCTGEKIGTIGYIDPQPSTLEQRDWWAFGQTALMILIGTLTTDHVAPAHELTNEEIEMLPKAPGWRELLDDLTGPFDDPSYRPKASKIASVILGGGSRAPAAE